MPIADIILPRCGRRMPIGEAIRARSLLRDLSPVEFGHELAIGASADSGVRPAAVRVNTLMAGPFYNDISPA